MGHIFACGWFAAGSANEPQRNGEIIVGWVDRIITDRELTMDDWGTKYLDAVYYAVTTLTTVGYGDRVPHTNTEKIFSILTELAGGILFGILAGTLSSMVMATNIAEKAST